MRSAPAVFLILLGLVSGALGSDAAPTDWHPCGQSHGITLYSRVRTGSPVKEFKAVGMIDAPTRVVHNVLNDVGGYPQFMPFTAECRIIKRQGDSIYAYQRISPGICHDRDYTLHIMEKSWPGEGGIVYLNTWTPANDVGPAERKGVQRVSLCEGRWLLEPAGPARTRATYCIYTDSGGSLPVFIASVASKIGIGKIFSAVRDQVKDTKYYEYRDFLTGTPHTPGNGG
jgi:Polyketide cyclase / dehydrase and lipid transport